jgi:CHAD domain-containing protein
MTFHLYKNEPIAPGLRRIAHEQIGIVLEEFAQDTLPVGEQVHSLRSRCKKMRALLRLPQPLMGDAFTVEDQRFRSAARELAEFRDRDVVSKTARALGSSAFADFEPDGPIPAAAIERALAFMSGARDAVANWPLSELRFVDLAPGFAQTYRSCTEKWRAVRADPADEKYHKLRKWVKYHWYQVRILERLSKPQLHVRREMLRELQATLGDAHDIVMLESVIGAAEEPDARLLQRAITRKAELYDKAVRIGEEVFVLSEEQLLGSMITWSDPSGR